MKKMYTLFLATLLVFSLVGCGNKNNETSEETMEESINETMEETTKETQGESDKAEKTFSSLALNKDIVIASAEGIDARVYKSKTSGLMQGHKYDFTIDPSTIEEGDTPIIEVDLGGISGKEIGYPISAEVYNQLKDVVEYKVVDTRDAEKFSDKNIENSINITAEMTNSWMEEGAEKPEIEGISEETIIVIVGDNEEENSAVAEALYKVLRVNVTLNAGNFEELAK